MRAGSTPRYRWLQSVSLGAILLLHGAGLWALSRQAQQVTPPKPASALFVSFVTPPAPEPVKPPEPLPPVPPPPEPVVKPKPRVIATAQPAPSPEAMTVEPPPPDEPAPAESMAVAAEPGPPEPAPVEKPRFDMAYLNNPAPSYPAMSRKLKEQGQVLLRVLVSAGGDALQVEIERSSGYSRLDDAAQRAVRKWRFVPAKRGEEKVEGWALVPIVFEQKG